MSKQDILRFIAVRPGFPEVEQLATSNQIVGRNQLMFSKMKCQTCYAGHGASPKNWLTYTKNVLRFEELLTHPLIGMVLFPSLSTNSRTIL